MGGEELSGRCAAALAAATLSFAVPVAQGAEPASREAVRAEAASAARAGQIPRNEASEPAPPKGSTRPRSEVKAETRAAVKAGTIEHGESSSVPPTPAAPASGPPRTRAEVRAEAASSLGLKASAPKAAAKREP